VLVCACTTMRPIEAPPAEVQRIIIEENEIVAVDLDARLVHGKNVSVPIDEVVAVETREVSVGKTAALAGGVAAVWIITLILAAPGFILAGGGGPPPQERTVSQACANEAPSPETAAFSDERKKHGRYGKETP
jgi:hypothetical protein